MTGARPAAARSAHNTHLRIPRSRRRLALLVSYAAAGRRSLLERFRSLARRPGLPRPQRLAMTNRATAVAFAVLVVAGMGTAWASERAGLTRIAEDSALLPDLAAIDVLAVTARGGVDTSAAGRGWAASTQHPEATEIAAAVLETGGNAVDAAIAAAFAVAAASPYGSGLGGGGVLLVAPVSDPPIVLDYLSAAGSRQGHRPVAVPGFVPGLVEAHAAFGTLPWEQLVGPSAELAASGAALTTETAQRVATSSRLPGSDPLVRARARPGQRIAQPDLAATLRRVAADPQVAITGDIAAAVESAAGDGISLRDMADYEPVWREPLAFEIPGAGTLVTVPPPAGGALFAAASGALSLTGPTLGTDAIDAFARRWSVIDQLRMDHIGDPAFVDVDVDAVLAPTEVTQLPAGDAELSLAKSDTTHLSIVDGDGMMVSMTNTLSEFFGSGQRVEGFYLNNTLDNFSRSPGSANRWEPGKRPRTFLAPSVLASSDGGTVALGSAGGRRIPTALAQVVSAAGGTSTRDRWSAAVDAPRIHPEGGVIALEPGVEVEAPRLRAAGYQTGTIDRPSFFGGVQVAGLAPDGSVFAVSDPRRSGAARTGQ
jgi:gamma-glutamyltranspeptidase / glutathione hydrolase